MSGRSYRALDAGASWAKERLAPDMSTAVFQPAMPIVIRLHLPRYQLPDNGSCLRGTGGEVNVAVASSIGQLQRYTLPWKRFRRICSATCAAAGLGRFAAHYSYCHRLSANHRP
ncbi:hypothetical protein CHELA20_53725 [Hyphomicrobiales bacterium]|nr:hypothetical protein CHELA41_21201 [Hyphomicrobiales bacterium]CAH1684824.1 hypothetical protein CHELA20_53725 [Hyphomicrobiales bacterium]